MGTDSTEIKEGARVRSYDFPGNGMENGLFFRSDCYVVGVVVSVGAIEHEGCPRYEIAIEGAVFGGKPIMARTTKIIPPVNGTRTLFGGVCDGVVLDTPEAVEAYLAKNPNRSR